MNKVQSNYVYMGKSVLVTFHKNENVWTGEQLIVEGVGKIHDLLGKIDVEAARQKDNETPGFTAVKEQKRDMLEEALFRVCGRLKVYAVRSGDAKMAEKVRFTRTDLNNMSMTTLLTAARTVAGLAEGLPEALAAYRVTPEDVAALRELAGVTDRLYAERDAAQSERTKNTSQLAALISRLRSELKLMDTQVEAYIDDEEFLRTYFAARRIHDVRSGSIKKPDNGGEEK
jgi:hypothetical protein